MRSVTFLVTPEGIQVEKNFSTRGTCQPHSQMPSVHMCADCSTWGQWPLCATLNSALVDPHDALQLKAKGYHVGWDTHLWSLWPSWRGGFQCQFFLTNCRIKDFSATFLESWGGGLETVVLEQDGFFRWGWDGGNGSVGYGTSQEPVEILCLWSCHC